MYFLTGNNLGLRPLLHSDINQSYLNWLNDPEVNFYSGRRNNPSNQYDIETYLSSLGKDEHVLAICKRNNEKHIGNIKYGPIDWINRTCEIEILIGDKNEWDQGYGAEAIYLITKHLFHTINMNRVEAKSANPAFITSTVKKLGWTHEGEMRERFFMGHKFIGYHFLSILKNEFKIINKYELQ